MDARITAKHRQLLGIAEKINESFSRDLDGTCDFIITEESLLFEYGFIEFDSVGMPEQMATLNFRADLELEYILSITNALTKLGFQIKTQAFVHWSDDDNPTELVPVSRNIAAAFIEESENILFLGYRINEPNRLESLTAKAYIKLFREDFEAANKLAI